MAEKLKRLYNTVEDGSTDLDDLLNDRLASLKPNRGRSQIALDRVKSQASVTTSFDPATIGRFGRTRRENIRVGDVPIRTAYFRAVIDRIEVDNDVIRIVGDKVFPNKRFAAG